MIIKQQANYAKASVLPVHLVSEFTSSFSFTPSSEKPLGNKDNWFLFLNYYLTVN